MNTNVQCVLPDLRKYTQHALNADIGLYNFIGLSLRFNCRSTSNSTLVHIITMIGFMCFIDDYDLSQFLC